MATAIFVSAMDAIHASQHTDKVFIVTNRKSNGRGGGGTRSFGFHRADAMTYCAVDSGEASKDDSLADSAAGRGCTSHAWRGPSSRLRASQFSNLSAEKFFVKLSATKSKSIIVFVHGYNCNLNVPCSIAANLNKATGLPVVMFAWPSKRNPFTYATDECNAEWSSFQLAELLQELNKRYENKNLILVGHSMGCRILCWALQHQAAGVKSFAGAGAVKATDFGRQIPKVGDGAGKRFQHIFLCAPDMDSQVFEKNAPLFVENSNDTTVFASSKDVRLIFSEMLHGNSRLGLISKSYYQAGGNSYCVGMVNVVDYTYEDKTILGHAVPYQLIKRRIEQQAATVTE